MEQKERFLGKVFSENEKFHLNFFFFELTLVQKRSFLSSTSGGDFQPTKFGDVGILLPTCHIFAIFYKIKW